MRLVLLGRLRDGLVRQAQGGLALLLVPPVQRFVEEPVRGQVVQQVVAPVQQLQGPEPWLVLERLLQMPRSSR
jgi:hypothetical protein